jgi:hypothetical protein
MEPEIGEVHAKADRRQEKYSQSEQDQYHRLAAFIMQA